MRREFLKACCLASALATLLGAAAAVHAQETYPTRPIRIIIGGTPGGSSDVFARTMGDHMSATLGQPFIIEYKPGAGTNIGTEYVVRAKPDGYTILINGLPIVANPHLFPDLPFNPANDLVPVTGIALMTNVVTVNSALPIKSMTELVAAAKQSPDRFVYGSPGEGTSTHIAGEMLSARTGAKFIHTPYRGNAQAMTDLLGGTLPLGFINTPVVAPFLKEGRLRALAVTSKTRSPLMPDVPTVAEALDMPDFDFNGWFGFFAPKGTPPAAIAALEQAAAKALADPKVTNIFVNAGATAMAPGTENFTRFVAAERRKIDPLLEKRGK
ncbi:Tripartite tricarboxylate transporter family receptor [Pigmentiphaga humi]|uniref:Tripartite tricarboxylate transporter family receptor n=1 Tax=Pigmentiphaga humi TaxID=2478468 RepID=A0A3P4B3Y9_9BURK|nr:tripartite tricarboxylate transporter substrate binding protein [Pigmentiphaga humi]VCU69865.1 Tripartite tricarboxylate transporter family receptor [Pigmentiphaga humi]